MICFQIVSLNEKVKNTILFDHSIVFKCKILNGKYLYSDKLLIIKYFVTLFLLLLFHYLVFLFQVTYTSRDEVHKVI